MMTLREAKQSIRAFIRKHWSDQKLHDVYAFNRDGKMYYFDTCACLLGVTVSDRLHVMSHCTDDAYVSLKKYQSAKNLSGARKAESGYARLYYSGGNVHNAQRRLSAILRAEMRRRSRERGEPQTQQIALTPIKSEAD